MDPVTARERELGDATGVKTQPPPQVLHTRLSSWLPAAKLNDLSAAAMEVSKTLNAEFASWLRGRVRSTTDVK